MASRWEPALPSHWSAAGRPLFVGRTSELAVLEDAWTAVHGRGRQVVFIGGEPGAGKTRLMTEVALEAHRLGAVVLNGRCLTDLGVPYQPFDGPASALLDAVANGLTALLRVPSTAEDVSRHLAVLAGDDDPDTTSTPRIDERKARYDAFVGCLRAVAEHRPLVLALDDLHGAGSTALQLLTYLVEQTQDCPLLVLATHRTTAPDRSSELVDEVASLHRLDGVRRLDLAPLDTESIADYLVVEGRVPRRRAAQAAVLLRDRTGGNAFYLCEVWRHLSARGGVGAVHDAGVRTPQAVVDALARRIRALSEPQRRMLTLAAVLGEEVKAHEVVPLLRATDSLPALDDLVETGLLEELPDQYGTYRFVHALVRQATLDAVSSLERAEHHEKVALLLKARGASARRLAHHFAGASLLGHSASAVRYLTEAAEAADRSLAHAEAAALFEQASTHCTDVPSREQCLLRAARSYALACAFREALDLYRQLSLTTDPDRRLEAVISYEEMAWLSADSGDHVIAPLRAAMADAAVGRDHPQYIRAMASLTRATAYAGRHGEAELLATDTVEQSRGNGDDSSLATALWAAVHVGIRPATHVVKRARADELTAVAARTGRWIYLGPAAYHRSTLAYQHGDAQGLAAARADLERTAVAAGQRYWNYMADCAAYGTAFIQARFAEADRRCENLLELSRDFTGSDREGLYGVQSFMVRRETGAVRRVERLISGSEPYEGHWLPALLALYTELGLDEPAGRLLHHIVDHHLRSEDPESGRRPATLAFVAEAALAQRDREAAADVRRPLMEYEGANLIMGPFAAVFGAADRYLAELDSLLGDGSADRRFTAALDLDTRTGSVLHRAYTLVGWSAHARANGDGPLAARLTKEASALAQAHSMVRVTDHLARTAERGRRAPAPCGLSEREQEVLRLIGSGHSNREIARALTISEHTAANHVRHIMTKTGCGNRTQAAMFAAAHGLLD